MTKNSRILPEGWCLFDDSEKVAEAALDLMIDCANRAIKDKGSFHLVTAGGTTPNLIYQQLAELEQKQPEITDWQKWFIYMGDERVLPSGDAERNSQVLKKLWLADSQIPQKQQFFMRTELGLQVSADDYRKIISSVEFDLVMLGMGEDGHTASLFPGHSSVSLGGVVCENQSPKPPSERLSLSYERLSSARTVLKLVTGSSKESAVKDWLEGEDLPISRVKGIEQTLVYLDKPAFQK